MEIKPMTQALAIKIQGNSSASATSARICCLSYNAFYRSISVCRGLIDSVS